MAAVSGVVGALETAHAQLTASRAAAERGLGLALELRSGCLALELAALAEQLGQLAERMSSVVEELEATRAFTRTVTAAATALADRRPGAPPAGRGGSHPTAPSRRAGDSGRPRGTPARIRPADDEPTERGRRRENEAAEVLARRGYDVEQSPTVPGRKRPDYRIEGRVFDAYSPSTHRVRNICDTLENKLAEGQASRFVVNLADTPVTAQQLRSQLAQWPVDGLEEVFAVKDGAVVRVFP